MDLSSKVSIKCLLTAIMNPIMMRASSNRDDRVSECVARFRDKTLQNEKKHTEQDECIQWTTSVFGNVTCNMKLLADLRMLKD